MQVELDHVTQFVVDRDVVADTLRQRGLNAVAGGRHPGFGSANNLCYFDLFYVEILAIVDAAEAASGASAICRAAVSYLEKGEGFGNMAFETDDLPAVADAMRAAGMIVDAPVRMQRVHSDGRVSLSRIIYPRAGALGAPIPVPIVLQRDVPPAERRADLTRLGVIAPHKAGDLEVDHVAICVRDLDGARAFFERGFGLKAEGPVHVDRTLGARCLRMPTDRAAVVLCAPDGAGPVADRLAVRDPGPFLLGLKSHDAGGVARSMGADEKGLISPERMHGAWFRIVLAA